jgi:hypothetical protein
MTIQEIYLIAKKENHYSLVLLIEFLTLEKKVLKGNDTEDKLTYYLQDKFHRKMNNHLAEYEVKRNAN